MYSRFISDEMFDIVPSAENSLIAEHPGVSLSEVVYLDNDGT